LRSAVKILNVFVSLLNVYFILFPLFNKMRFLHRATSITLLRTKVNP
jgi:hypothetical protein